MSAINDPLGQSHSSASSNRYSHLLIDVFRKILKQWGWTYRRTDGRTDTTCENSNHYRLWVWINYQYWLVFHSSFLFVYKWSTSNHPLEQCVVALEANLATKVLLFPETLPKRKSTRQVSSMIHAVRPTVSPVVNVGFSCYLFYFCLILKIENGRPTCAKQLSLPAVTVGRPSGSTKHTCQNYIRFSCGSKY